FCMAVAVTPITAVRSITATPISAEATTVASVVVRRMRVVIAAHAVMKRKVPGAAVGPGRARLGESTAAEKRAGKPHAAGLASVAAGSVEELAPVGEPAAVAAVAINAPVSSSISFETT